MIEAGLLPPDVHKSKAPKLFGRAFNPTIPKQVTGEIVPSIYSDYVPLTKLILVFKELERCQWQYHLLSSRMLEIVCTSPGFLWI